MRTTRKVRTLVRKASAIFPYSTMLLADEWAWIHAHRLFGIHGLEALYGVTVVLWWVRAWLVPYQLRMSVRHWRGRAHIPVRLRRATYAADGWQCVACGSLQELQLDHVRPWSCGGLNRLWNMVTLCARCNKIKSNYWVWPSGIVTYEPWPGLNQPDHAAAILAVERRVRLNPWRWCRAVFTLA